MSLLNIHNKFILYDIIFQIPIKRRIAIINGAKNYYKSLGYFPVTIKLYEKILNYLNSVIDEYCPKKKCPFNTISNYSLYDLVDEIQEKFPKQTNNFKELIQEIIIEKLKEKNIYIYYDFSNEYEGLFKFNYYNNIIQFDHIFCNLIRNKSEILECNMKKIFGIDLILSHLENEISESIKMEIFEKEINDEPIEESKKDSKNIFNLLLNDLDLLNKNFTWIRYLKLNFSYYFNNFDEDQTQKIFDYVSQFSKQNPIEILYFKDNTERTDSFIENYKSFVKLFPNLNEFYIYKFFKNDTSREIISKAFENKEEIIDSIEDPQYILHNYLDDINTNIKLLHVEVSNPCYVNGWNGGGSFYGLASPNEEFTIISKFKNLEQFVLRYDWVYDSYYYDFDGSTLIDALNSLSNLQKVIFMGDSYLSEIIPKLKIKDVKFINE